MESTPATMNLESSWMRDKIFLGMTWGDYVQQ